jgi:hypothetical protein
LKRLSLPALCIFLLSLSFPARAGRVNEATGLSFGNFAVIGAHPQQIVIPPTGSESHSAGIFRMNPRGQYAVFLLSHFPVNTSLYVTVNDTTLDRVHGGATFDITDFTFDPDCTMATPCSTDGAGNLTVKIGATLNTRAATAYSPGAYSGTYDLMLNF